MLRHGEGGAMKIRHGVATLAAILVRCRGKLPCVRVLMTIRALSERHFVPCVLARRDVARGTSYGRVFAL